MTSHAAFLLMTAAAALFWSGNAIIGRRALNEYCKVPVFRVLSARA
jgi:hypothetical protein